MNHLDKYKLFESKEEELKEYFYDFIDMNFKIDIEKAPGFYNNGYYTIQLDLEEVEIDKHEIINTFDVMVGRISDQEALIHDQIIFVNHTCSILIKVKDLEGYTKKNRL
jgi:hypothetical protein